MKHLVNMITERAAAAGIALESVQAERIADHLKWVLETNEHTNLTAISDIRSGVELHVVDSLAVLPEVRAAAEGPMLDIGSGGGFPGIPLGVATGRTTTLLDSVGKKAALVEAFIFERGWSQFSVVNERAEEHAAVAGSVYALAIARAVSSLPSLTELASPLLRVGGVLIAMKGHLSADERRSGVEAAKLVGLEEVSFRQYELSDAATHRCVVVYQKVEEPQMTLPRRIGRAQKRPLA